MNAVITGDLVSSTKLSEDKRNSTRSALEDEARKEEKFMILKEPEVFYRGDSLQVVVKIQEALRIGLCMRLKAKMMTERKSDLRFAIGLGETEYLYERVTTSDGEAFRYSGRTLDGMGEARMRVKTRNEHWDECMNTAFLLADKLINNWSIEVVEAVYYSLKGKTQKELAKQFGISQPAVHKRLKTGGYQSIQQLVNHYQKAVQWI